MHMEIQVALNFVINYLYNKLPRRRVNIFGEELEKALKDKFKGHWYPEKPFKGSAFRCLKTGDPTDAVLERAAKESGVPISDILENLPAELSVWVDPGEVSYRIGEKGSVKILYSENNDNHHDDTSADREVTKTFNPEAQCFRPIDAVNTSMNGLNISPKTSPNSGSSPASSASPTYKGSPNAAAAAFLARSQAQLTFTTATFAQTKFGSTKLKTNSKRNNSNNSFRMSPTEFSNYIKQRQIQQQIHHSHGQSVPAGNNHFGPIGPSSPSRSLSPNSIGVGMQNNPAESFFFNNMGNNGMYQQFNGHRNIFGNIGDNNGGNNSFHQQQQQQQQQQLQSNDTNGIFTNGLTKFSQYMEPSFFGALNGGANTSNVPGGLNSGLNLNSNNNNSSNSATTPTHKPNTKKNGFGVIGSGQQQSQTQQPQSSSPIPGDGSSSSNTSSSSTSSSSSSNSSSGSNSKLMDGLNSFYSNGTYQHLLVAN